MSRIVIIMFKCVGCFESASIEDYPKSTREYFPSFRSEVFTMVAMKNGSFWDIKNPFVPHKEHITSPLQGQTC
jgi:hypothetical protein